MVKDYKRHVAPEEGFSDVYGTTLPDRVVVEGIVGKIESEVTRDFWFPPEIVGQAFETLGEDRAHDVLSYVSEHAALLSGEKVGFLDRAHLLCNVTSGLVKILSENCLLDGPEDVVRDLTARDIAREADPHLDYDISTGNVGLVPPRKDDAVERNFLRVAAEYGWDAAQVIAK